MRRRNARESIDFLETGYSVQMVRFKAEVYFDAYVVANVDGDIDIERVQREIADAIEYHAPHLSETEDGDALIALVGGGSSMAVDVTVEVAQCVTVGETEPLSDVADAIEQTEAWT